MSAAVSGLQTGRIAPLGPEGEPSAIVKTARAGAVGVGTLGLEGDVQADLREHGGPDKAVYAYGLARYAAWAQAFPELAAQFLPGSMGENLTIAGMTEDDLCVGDVHAIGTALLQVCQPRQPCFKFALRFGNNRLPKAMVRSGHSGWYYRVLRNGVIGAGDAVQLHDRPHPAFAFPRLVSIVNHGDASEAELRAMAQMGGLAAQWRAAAAQSLAKARG